MNKVLCWFAVAMVGCLIGAILSAEVHAQDVPPVTPVAPITPDVVTLKNGSTIFMETSSKWSAACCKSRRLPASTMY